MSHETLTVDAVSPLLRTRLDPGLECISVAGGVVGNGQETWFVQARAADGALRKLVIRRSAAAGTQQDTERAREFAVLEVVRHAGLPVPAVHWLEVDDSSLGRPYFVMDHLPGHAPARPTALERIAIIRQVGEWLARLHRIDIDELPAAIPRAPDATAETRIEHARWRQQYLRTRPESIPLLGALLAWLEVELPPARRKVSLLWGDPGPHNVLVEGDMVTGLVDWEQAHVGDPLEDLGAAIWSCLDTYDPAVLIAGYESVAGPVDRGLLCYYEVFASVSRAIMLAGGVSAYLNHRATPSLAALGQHLLLESLARAARAAGWGEPPAPSPPAPENGPSSLRLRPDVPEIAHGVARFLRSDVIGVIEERNLRAQVKTAAALLDTIVTRSAQEPVMDALSADLEAEAMRAERDRSPERGELRARLLADLADQRSLITALADLYRR